MRFTKLALLTLLAAAVAACTSVGPSSTPFISTPVTPIPGSSALPSIAPPTLPTETVPPASIVPGTEAPSLPPTEASPTPSPTPKPTKKPTPTPVPTPTPIAADLEVSIQQPVPDPFYNNTDETVRIYVSALGTQDVPNAHLKLVVQNEGVTYKFDTGPIAITDSYYKDVVVNVPAIGPSALIASATVPDGYVDTKKSNNTDTVNITVELAP